ncbi:putative ABC transporter permease [Suilimivivens sp.]|uniref:putative ABC transporter permease n=1 Tax=Suilimivivens sp. TaxID=2981669 RepID=UPI00307C392E
MWTRELFGSDVYHLIAAFIIYSVLGWFVESAYMSFCNHRLTNRGFAKGPFCPIYGFGAVIGYLVLNPLSGHYVTLYLTGAFLATTFEYLVGIMMQKLLGEVWWDYTEKPMNYKGIICLESTIAWGFYAIIITMFLHERVLHLIDAMDMAYGRILCIVILAIVTVDYLIRLYLLFKTSIQEEKDRLIDKYRSFRTRWY